MVTKVEGMGDGQKPSEGRTFLRVEGIHCLPRWDASLFRHKFAETPWKWVGKTRGSGAHVAVIWWKGHHVCGLEWHFRFEMSSKVRVPERVDRPHGEETRHLTFVLKPFFSFRGQAGCRLHWEMPGPAHTYAGKLPDPASALVAGEPQRQGGCRARARGGRCSVRAAQPQALVRRNQGNKSV